MKARWLVAVSAGVVIGGASFAIASGRDGAQDQSYGPELAQELGLEPTSGDGCNSLFIEQPFPDFEVGTGYCLPSDYGLEDAGLLTIRLGGREPTALEQEYWAVMEEISLIADDGPQSSEEEARFVELSERKDALIDQCRREGLEDSFCGPGE